MTCSGLSKEEVLTLVFLSAQDRVPTDIMRGIVTGFDMYTIPVHDISFSISIYTPDQAHACIDAFAEWQTTGASDLKATVTMIIGLESITVGLLYSNTSPTSDVFEPFNKLTPVVVPVPTTNGTVLSLTQILASTSSTAPMR